MPNSTHPTESRTAYTGTRKLLTLGHSRGITLPARWLKASGAGTQSYLAYRITTDGELIFYTTRPGSD